EVGGSRQIQSRKFDHLKKKRGPRLGSGAPKGRVPLIRPRRDRIMGSSILASLSEAGGNDPYILQVGPFLPTYRTLRIIIGTRPTHTVMQLDCLFCARL